MGLKGWLYRKMIPKTLPELQRQHRYYKGKTMVEREEKQLKTEIRSMKGEGSVMRGARLVARKAPKVGRGVKRMARTFRDTEFVNGFHTKKKRRKRRR